MEGGADLDIGGHRQLSAVLFRDDKVGIGKATTRVKILDWRAGTLREIGFEKDLLLSQAQPTAIVLYLDPQRIVKAIGLQANHGLVPFTLSLAQRLVTVPQQAQEHLCLLYTSDAADD